MLSSDSFIEWSVAGPRDLGSLLAMPQQLCDLGKLRDFFELHCPCV